MRNGKILDKMNKFFVLQIKREKKKKKKDEAEAEMSGEQSVLLLRGLLVPIAEFPKSKVCLFFFCLNAGNAALARKTKSLLKETCSVWTMRYVHVPCSVRFRAAFP